ncbi:MAG: hypothetical protein JNL28_16335 [Planctomycetes bacterium]|nr:hypothetical protein [Planctomycetota bacterium]
MLQLALLFALATQNPAADPSANVLRLYDLSAVLPVGSNEEGESVLLPILRDFGSDYGPTSGSWGRRDAAPVVEFLRALNPEEWQRAGRSLSVDERARLHVTAPPAAQEFVARGIAFLESTLNRPTTIVIDTVMFGPNPGVATLPAVMPISEVARWTGVGSGHESYELAIRPGERCRQRSERVIGTVLGGDVEVAERSIGWAARPQTVSIGTAIDAAVSPGKGGLWLALNLKNGRFLDVESKREEPRGGLITNDHTTEHISGPQLRSDPRLANHSLSINTFLPDGKALAFVTTAGLESRVVFVRCTDGPAPLTWPLPEDLKRLSSRPATVLTRADLLHPPLAHTRSGDDIVSIASLAQLARDGQRNPHVLAGIDMSIEPELSDALESKGDDYELRSAGAWLGLFAARPAAPQAQLTLAHSTLPAPRLVTATIALRRSARDGPTLSRAIVPIRAGAASTVILGREALFTAAIDIEVACGAVVPSTSIARLFDGLVVTLEPRGTVDGGLTVMIDTHCAWSRTQPRDLELGGKLPTRVQLMDVDVLDAQRTVTFSASDTAPRRVTLGSAGSGVEALSLEIELSDVR